MARGRQWASLGAVAAAVALAAIALRPAGERAPPARGPSGRPRAPPCTPEQLSCGLQKPVVSDGVRQFRNENFLLSAIFPRGSRVCLTRSGDSPHGFFARYGAGQDCAERPERGPEFIVVHGDFNALFETSLRKVLPGACGPLSEAVRRRLGRSRLSFPHYRSATCETPAEGGAIEISVYALAGPWQRAESIPGRSRMAIYFATLGTTRARLDADLARFRQVLGSVEIRDMPYE